MIIGLQNFEESVATISSTHNIIADGTSYDETFY
jgi:hypothetical protein